MNSSMTGPICGEFRMELMTITSPIKAVSAYQGFLGRVSKLLKIM
jgi:hypothetical protein